MPKIWLKSMVFLDSNILLEIILKDRVKRYQVRKYLESISKLDDFSSISMLTVHLIMHFGRKEQIDDYFLQAVINENELFSLSAEDYEWALVNERGKDFEDALQLAVAMRTNCDTFLTLDKKLARDYADLPLKILVV